MTVSSKDTKIDVSADWNRAIFDRGRPFHIDGTELTFHIPFTGERDLLQVLAIDLHLISAVARQAGH